MNKWLKQSNSIGLLMLIVGGLKPVFLHAQSQLPVPQPPVYQIGVSLSYFGDVLTHPGTAMNIELNLRPRHQYQLRLSANVGGYLHRRNHTGLFTNVQLTQRYVFKQSFFVEQSVGLGYLRTYPNGDGIYEIASNGQVSRAANTGLGSRMTLLSAGFGWDLSRRPTPHPLVVFVRPQAFWQYPFNGHSLLHPAFQIGATKLIP